MNCITSNCKNPEKALAFLQLINTDSKVRDAFYYGLEGDNFEYTADGRVHKNNSDWSMAGYTQATFFNVTITDDTEVNQWDEVRALNESAKPSALLGFTFDTTNVADQVANCNEVWNRYKWELCNGVAEPEAEIAAMNKELDAAGFQDVLAEAQAQVNAFLGK
jgi:putative aldouronate transport system substrate-binding protein